MVMRAQVMVVLAILFAGCSSPGPADAGGDGSSVVPAAKRLECGDCRLDFAGRSHAEAHQVAAHPIDAQRAAAALLYTPPVDPSNPAPTVPVVLNRGSIAVTTDGGRTWTSSVLPTAPGEGTPAYSAVAWGPDGSLWATALLTTGPDASIGARGAGVGVGGPIRVYRSFDDGQTWQTQTTLPDGDGYGNIAILDGMTYATWAQAGRAYVAWSPEGGPWRTVSTEADCFSVSKVVASARGLAMTCTYQFAAQGTTTISFLFDAVQGTLQAEPESLDCPNGGPAVLANGTMVVATICSGLQFHARVREGWQRFADIDLDRLVAQSPLVADATGTLHVLVVQNLAAGEIQVEARLQTFHAWLAPDGRSGAEPIASFEGLMFSGATGVPFAEPCLDGGGAAIWLLAADEGILATRLVA